MLKVAGRERARTQGSHELTHAVIRYLYKLMACKDEYEVARLHLKPDFHGQALGLFDEPVRLIYHLHPPLLRALGLKRKLAFGPWFTPVLRMLHSLRTLRHTPLDIFGYAKVRREERRLITWHKELVDTALGYLAPQTHSRIVEIAQLPDGIRGYEQIKLNNLRSVKEKAEKLLASLSTQAAASP